jgi:hypothetical protein
MSYNSLKSALIYIIGGYSILMVALVTAVLVYGYTREPVHQPRSPFLVYITEAPPDLTLTSVDMSIELPEITNTSVGHTKMLLMYTFDGADGLDTEFVVEHNEAQTRQLIVRSGERWMEPDKIELGVDRESDLDARHYLLDTAEPIKVQTLNLPMVREEKDPLSYRAKPSCMTVGLDLDLSILRDLPRSDDFEWKLRIVAPDWLGHSAYNDYSWSIKLLNQPEWLDSEYDLVTGRTTFEGTTSTVPEDDLALRFRVDKEVERPSGVHR